MIINQALLNSMSPCENRYDNFKKNYEDKDRTLKEFLSLDKISHKDKLWVVIRLMNNIQKIEFACYCAESVIHIYDKYNSDSQSRRECISAARNVIKCLEDYNRKCISSYTFSVALEKAYTTAVDTLALKISMGEPYEPYAACANVAKAASFIKVCDLCEPISYETSTTSYATCSVNYADDCIEYLKENNQRILQITYALKLLGED